MHEHNNNLYTIITGASQGLGKALAYECASRGMNLVLISLPNEGLYNLQKEIISTYHVSVRVFEADLTVRTSINRLVLQLQNFSINMLINNAGCGGSFNIEKVPLQLIEAIIELNIRAPVYLCCKLLPELARHQKSYILNVSSIMSQYPAAYKTVYPASKAFIFSFSYGLREELKDTNVKVSVLVPGGMMTNKLVAKQMKGHGILARLSIVDTDWVAKVAIDGLLSGKSVIVPGLLNKLSWLLMHLFPLRLGMPLISRFNRNELQSNER